MKDNEYFIHRNNDAIVALRTTVFLMLHPRLQEAKADMRLNDERKFTLEFPDGSRLNICEIIAVEDAKHDCTTQI